LPHLKEGIKELVSQKVELGLLPAHAIERVDACAFDDVVAVLAIAEPNYKSSCWSKLQEVMAHADPLEVVTIDKCNRAAMDLPEVIARQIAVDSRC